MRDHLYTPTQRPKHHAEPPYTKILTDPPPESAGDGLNVIAERRQLVGLGYRLLGSVTDAEEVVQEAYARWYAMPIQERSAIESPGGWLTTVASRICLNLLASARMRRESYVGDWIPEPLPDLAEWSKGPSKNSAIDPGRPRHP
jgi:RNA polymerase sigma-70 factor (ECF subfamily)